MANEFTCPGCGSHDSIRDEADIGVGIQYGPWHCQSCGWNESTACPVCGGDLCAGCADPMPGDIL